MSVDIGALRTFLAVVDCGSMTDAARVRGYSAAAVSRHVAALQRRWGVTLFVPSGRSVRPTPEAIELAERARVLVHEMMRLERYLRDVERRRDAA